MENANSFFIIEISTNTEGSLYIVAHDIKSDQSLMIQQGPEKARRFIAQFNNDFQAIAESVQLSDDGRSLRLQRSTAPPANRVKRALFSQGDA